jgi:hypothetical protein
MLRSPTFLITTSGPDEETLTEGPRGIAAPEARFVYREPYLTIRMRGCGRERSPEIVSGEIDCLLNV